MSALDTGTEDLRAEIDDGVAVITMSRPDRRNAFSQAMVSALGAVLAQVEADDAVGCVVLTGAGGAFCAGGDGKSMDAASADRGDGAGPSLDARINRQRLNQRATSGSLWSMPKPTIAADYGGSWFLTRLVGSSKSKELYYFSERLSAKDALRLGIVNAIFAPADFEREVMDRARRLAHGPSVAYRYMKENLN